MKSINQFNLHLFCCRLFLTSFLYLTLGLAGCEKDSTDVAKQKIDRSADTAQQNIEGSKDAAKDQIDALKNRVDENAELRKDQIDQSAEASKKSLEKSEDRVEQNADKAKDRVEQVEESKKEKVEDMKDSSNPSYLDDTMITTKVKAALVADPILGASDIEVTTNQGVVQLSGTVNSDQGLTKAMEIARSQDKVKDVQSSLVVNAVPSSAK